MPRLNIRVLDQTFEDWSPEKMYMSEAVAIERAYGASMRQLGKDLTDGWTSAQQILAWALLRRRDPSLRVADVDMQMGSFDVDTVCDLCPRLVHQELLRDEKGKPLVDDDGQPTGEAVWVHDDDRTAMCAEGEEVRGDDPLPGVGAPTEPSSSADSSTSEPSPTSSPSDPGSGTD